MSAVKAVAQLRDQLALYWLARTEQERKYLTIGGFTVVGALVFMLFIDPALSGIKKLNVQLPLLRIEASKMQGLAQEAAELAAQPAPQVTPMTRESVSASLTARSLTPTSLVITGQFAKIQLNGVPFPSLYAWLEAQRRENRMMVQELGVTASATPGQVDAALTLQQDLGEPAR